MDIYRQYINPNASSKKTVNVGRMTAAAALVVSCVMAPLLGGIDQAFQFIQEYTGLVSLDGKKWKRIGTFALLGKTLKPGIFALSVLQYP